MPHVSRWRAEELYPRNTVHSGMLISHYNIVMTLKLAILLSVLQLFPFTGATKEIRRKSRDEMLEEGWNETNWPEFQGSDIKWVCQNEARNCDITWEGLERELLNATEVWIVDNEYNLQYPYRNCLLYTSPSPRD